MRSAALLEAYRRGAEPFAVLRTTWSARGLALGTGIYTSSARVTAAGHSTGIVALGEDGWQPVEYGSGIEAAELLAVETEVGIVDKDGTLIDMLDTYGPRGSAAVIDYAMPGLVVADWEPVFTGIVDNWSRDGLVTRLHLKTDDAALRTPVPSPVFKRTEWGAAYDGTIFGTHMPLVMGIHNAYLITARGMVPAVNIRYDKDIGYWWLVSIGHQVGIDRIHYDGIPQGIAEGSGWNIVRGVFGQNLLTILQIDEGFQPEEGVVVSVDCKGPDTTGLYSGTVITNPVRILRTVLEEYVYRTPPLGAYRGDHTIIDDTSWDAAEAFFEGLGADCGRRFGGDQGEETAAEVIESFLEAYPFTRIDWSELGQLAFTVIDPDDVDPGSAWLDLDTHHEGPGVPYAPGDGREVYTEVEQPYMFSSQEQKFLSSIEAHDSAALDERAVALYGGPDRRLLPIDNPWSQTRFTND